MSELDNPEMSNPYSSQMSVEWKEIATKALLTGTIAGAAASLLVPGLETVTLGGMEIPGSVAIGIGAGAGSVTGDFFHKYLAGMIPQSQKYASIESTAVSVGGAIIGSYVVMNAMGSVPIQTPIVLGGASYVGADYLYFRVFNSKTGGFIY